MVWQRPGRRALVATLTVVAALLPVSLIAAVSALGDAPGAGGNSGAGPAIVGFSPRNGPIGGGTTVHISGGGFSEVTGVSFGGHPARLFEVKSDNLIDAVTPSMTRAANVHVIIAASGGTSVSQATFDFRGCHVPRLKHDRVERARKALVAAECKAGEVQRVPGARAPLRVDRPESPPRRLARPRHPGRPARRLVGESRQLFLMGLWDPSGTAGRHRVPAEWMRGIVWWLRGGVHPSAEGENLVRVASAARKDPRLKGSLTHDHRLDPHRHHPRPARHRACPPRPLGEARPGTFTGPSPQSKAVPSPSP